MSSIVHRDALTVGIPIQAPNYNNEANDMSLLSYAKKKKRLWFNSLLHVSSLLQSFFEEHNELFSFLTL